MFFAIRSWEINKASTQNLIIEIQYTINRALINSIPSFFTQPAMMHTQNGKKSKTIRV